MGQSTSSVQLESKQPGADSGVQAVARALRILMTVGRKGDNQGLKLVEIATHVGLHKSTTHRLVAALCKEGFLQQGSKTSHYRLGLSALEIGSLYLSKLTLRELAAPYLTRLMSEVDETVHLCILDDWEIVYIDRVESRGSVIVYNRIGSRQPAYCTAVGKAMLAYMPPAEVGQILSRGMPRKTKNTITSPRKFMDVIRNVRVLGYAISNEESREHVNAVAAPIFDHLGHPIAGIVVSGLNQRLKTSLLHDIGVVVKNAAGLISRQMGYKAGETTGE